MVDSRGEETCTGEVLLPPPEFFPLERGPEGEVSLPPSPKFGEGAGG
jgi:hypothetical protein